MTGLSLRDAVSEAPQMIGRYRLLCELGKGSMATLYLSREAGVRRFDRLFAVKMIHEHLVETPAFVSMFLNEAKIAARIHHPNVVAVLEVDQVDGRYFMAMEYVSGETLGAALRSSYGRSRPIPIELAAYVVSSACEGLHAAHDLRDSAGTALDVIHRDIAPQNIMLGYDGVVRLMDFGIAKALDSIGGTKPGVVKGTVAYMSPEQVRCDKLDRRTDLFSMGVVLWETLVGKRLFREPSDVRTAARILQMPIPRPSTFRSEVAPDIDAVVMKALERDPGLRFNTARELGDALRSCRTLKKRMCTASDLERFLKDTFVERYRERCEMEEQARSPIPSRSIQRPASNPSPSRDPSPAASVDVGASGPTPPAASPSPENPPSGESTRASSSPGSPPSRGSSPKTPTPANPAYASQSSKSSPRPDPTTKASSDAMGNDPTPRPASVPGSDHRSNGQAAIRPSLERNVATMVVRKDREATVEWLVRPSQDALPKAQGEFAHDGAEAPTALLIKVPGASSSSAAEEHEASEKTTADMVPLIDMSDPLPEVWPLQETSVVESPADVTHSHRRFVGLFVAIAIAASVVAVVFLVREPPREAAQPASRAEASKMSESSPSGRSERKREGSANSATRARESSATRNKQAPRPVDPVGGPSARVEIQFEVEPEEAQVFVDGVVQEGRSLVLPMSARTYDLLFTAPQHRAEKRSINANSSSTVRVVLTPLPNRASKDRDARRTKRNTVPSKRPAKAKSPSNSTLLFDGKDL